MAFFRSSDERGKGGGGGGGMQWSLQKYWTHIDSKNKKFTLCDDIKLGPLNDKSDFFDTDTDFRSYQLSEIEPGMKSILVGYVTVKWMGVSRKT